MSTQPTPTAAERAATLVDNWMGSYSYANGGPVQWSMNRETTIGELTAAIEAAEAAASAAAIERAYSVTADAWATARQRDEDPLDAWGEAITALHALLPGDVAGGE